MVKGTMGVVLTLMMTDTPHGIFKGFGQCNYSAPFLRHKSKIKTGAR